MLATSTFAGFRVKEDPAFMYDGVDFAHPLFICNEASSSSSKV